MSCHDIGRGLSSVVKVILEKLDTGEISVDTARDLLYACRKGVHWCDGNENEAMIQMHQMRCGYCLKKCRREILYILPTMSAMSSITSTTWDLETLIIRSQIIFSVKSALKNCLMKFTQELAQNSVNSLKKTGRKIAGISTIYADPGR